VISSTRVEHLPYKEKVVGSSPTSLTNFNCFDFSLEFCYNILSEIEKEQVSQFLETLEAGLVTVVANRP
jgi:hypothetical protein